MDERPAEVLRRELGVFGATMMGLGSILGTGVFVSIGIAIDGAGPAVVPAIGLAGVLAACNALNSAQLAVSHPVSGGTYEYGYAYLTPRLGFTAGWMFLCAKTASAATAALGFAGYLLARLGAADGLLVPVALGVVAVLTVLVLSGVRRTSHVNVAIVSLTLAALVAFCAAGTPTLVESGLRSFAPLFGPSATPGQAAGSVLRAAALMFVAYTGYGRIATLGEEVRNPRRTIPRAIVATLVVSALLYVAVGTVLIAAWGIDDRDGTTLERAAPLEGAAARFGIPGVAWLVGVGAMTAMLGVLLNLVLGLSRVLLAMGRRGDMPERTAALNAAQTTPYVAVLVVGAAVGGLTLIGDVRTTWSFSAFTVLIYYAITNLAALHLPRERRLYPPVLAWGGLAACLFLAFWVDWPVWFSGVGLIASGLVWHAAFASRRGSARGS